MAGDVTLISLPRLDTNKVIGKKILAFVSGEEVTPGVRLIPTLLTNQIIRHVFIMSGRVVFVCEDGVGFSFMLQSGPDADHRGFGKWILGTIFKKGGACETFLSTLNFAVGEFRKLVLSDGGGLVVRKIIIRGADLSPEVEAVLRFESSNSMETVTLLKESD